MKKDKKKKQKKQRPSGACALCHQPAQLHDSHIISEFLYKELYDAKHTYPLVEADPRKHGGPPPQQGIREYLLCGSCEQRFSTWETYASGVFRTIITSLDGRQTAGRVRVNVEYEPFRLFLLSLLWRLNATSHRLRGDLALEHHAERIRQILLSGTAPEPDQYPCILIALLLTEDGTFHPELILPPSTNHLDAFQVIRVVISGLVFMYFVPTEVPPTLSPLYLKRDGLLYIDVAPEEVIPAVFETRRRLGASELLRDVVRIHRHLVQNEQADSDAPVTLHFIGMDQLPEADSDPS